MGCTLTNEKHDVEKSQKINHLLVHLSEVLFLGIFLQLLKRSCETMEPVNLAHPLAYPLIFPLLPPVTKGRWSPFHLLRCSLHCGSSRFVLGKLRWGPVPSLRTGHSLGVRDTRRMWPTGLRCLDLSPGTSGPRKYCHKGTCLQSSRIPAWAPWEAGRGLRQILSLFCPTCWPHL